MGGLLLFIFAAEAFTYPLPTIMVVVGFLLPLALVIIASIVFNRTIVSRRKQLLLVALTPNGSCLVFCLLVFVVYPPGREVTMIMGGIFLFFFLAVFLGGGWYGYVLQTRRESR